MTRTLVADLVTMTRSDLPSAFLSYALLDRPLARHLVENLRRVGLAVWFDEDEVDPTRDIDLQILPALFECPCVLVLLTPNSVNKQGYVQTERRLATTTHELVAHGSLLTGGYWRPPDESEHHAFRYILYLAWEGVQDVSGLSGLDSDVLPFRGDLSSRSSEVLRLVGSRATVHVHADIEERGVDALSHPRMLKAVRNAKEVKPFRRVLSEMLAWPGYLSGVYKALLDGWETGSTPADSWTRRRWEVVCERSRFFERMADTFDRDLRIQTIRANLNDHAICMHMVSRFDAEPDPATCCHVCQGHGTVAHFEFDEGGRSMSDHNDNYVVLCTSCGYAWYDFNIDMNGNDLWVFDAERNIYRER